MPGRAGWHWAAQKTHVPAHNLRSGSSRFMPRRNKNAAGWIIDDLIPQGTGVLTNPAVAAWVLLPDRRWHWIIFLVDEAQDTSPPPMECDRTAAD